MSRPCPTCGEINGFHDDDAHALARSRIPGSLIMPPPPEPTKRGCSLEHPHDGPHQPYEVTS